MLKVTHSTVQICSVRRTIFVTVRYKFSKEQVIRRLMKEQKQCFGQLLETQSQKRRRLKREKKGIIDSKISESSVDSELSWVKKNSRVQCIHIKPSVVRTPTVPEKLTSLKSSNRHEQASLEAAEGLLMKFENRTPLLMDNKNPFPKKAIQKRILRKFSLNSCPASKARCEEPIMLQTDDIIKNINNAKLFKEGDGNCSDVWQNREVMSVLQMEYSIYSCVTSILNATMSDKAKQMLKVSMAKMIKESGQEGLNEHRTDLLENGTLFNSAIKTALRGLPVKVPLRCKLSYDSVKGLLDEIENVRAIGSHVVHRDLVHRGVLACVASYRGSVYLIDWPEDARSKILSSSTYDATLQIASYVGALNADDNYPFQINSGLLVIASTIGNKTQLHHIKEMKLQYYWKQWLERLKRYYAMQKK